jgi:hypothetical protein
MNYRALSEVIAPLQAGLLAVISLTVKDVDIVLAITIKIATIISIIFVCSYHYAKTKRIKKLNKQDDEKNIE